MRKNKRSSYEQAYNAQAVVDADGSQPVLVARVSQCSVDRIELVPDIEAIPESIGCPETVLADNGYLDEDSVRRLEGDADEPKMNVLVSVHAQVKQVRRQHDFRPHPTKEKQLRAIRSEFVLEMKEKSIGGIVNLTLNAGARTLRPIRDCLRITDFRFDGLRFQRENSLNLTVL
jgi:hypothetical protein